MKKLLAMTMIAALLAGNLTAADDGGDRPRRRRDGAGQEQREGGHRRNEEKTQRSNLENYTIEQAMSDNAQLHTIAFNGLAFLTGDFGAATFLPPGKVCDFFGFQYMRDIDAAGKGHNPVFLNRICGNVLSILSDEQRGDLKTLAEHQTVGLKQLALMRLPLIKAFYRAAEENVTLDKTAVVRYVGEIFEKDMELSIARAEMFGGIASSLTPEQKAALGKLKFGDFSTWPEVDASPFRLPRGTEKMMNVAYMTYASEFFSFYAGSVKADTYFCPERHGTYFGGFYMKDMPIMGKRDMDISTSITGDSGAEFLNLLHADQRKLVTSTIEKQRTALKEIASLRQKIAGQLRLFLSGKTPDRNALLAMGRRYGELDGEMSYYYADAFARTAKTLTAEQKSAMMKLRNLDGYASAPYYIYSAAQQDTPPTGDTGRFFTAEGK